MPGPEETGVMTVRDGRVWSPTGVVRRRHCSAEEKKASTTARGRHPPGLRGPMRRLGEDNSETLEYVPASFRVIRHVRPKLACFRAASGSCRPRRRRGRSRGARRPSAFWRTLWWRSTPTIFRRTGRARSMPARRWPWSARRWPTEWTAPARCCVPWSRRWPARRRARPTACR